MQASQYSTSRHLHVEVKSHHFPVELFSTLRRAAYFVHQIIEDGGPLGGLILDDALNCFERLLEACNSDLR